MQDQSDECEQRNKGGREAPEAGLSEESYEQLKRLAHYHLSSWRKNMTLNCTALVHEAYLKLCRSKSGIPNSQDHFTALASHAMRQILVDYARHKKRIKHGGDAIRITLQESSLKHQEPAIDLLALDSALTRLAEIDPLLEKVVVLRFFGGFNVNETAAALSRSTRSIERDWSRARLYLYRDLDRDRGEHA